MDNKNICDKTQVERYLLNQMEQEEETRFQEHLSRCESCRNYLAKVRAVAAIIGENNQPTSQKKKIQLWHWASVAACILFMAGISVFSYKKHQKAEEVLYPTSIEYRNRASDGQTSVKLLYPDQDSIYVPICQPISFKWDHPCTYQLKARYKETVLFDTEGNGSEYTLLTERFTPYPSITWDLKINEQFYSGQIIFSNK